MKKLLLLTAIICLTSCSKDCESESKVLLNDYNKAVQHANGNPDAIRELQRQYNQAKSNLDC